jgi:hypothetical protein
MLRAKKRIAGGISSSQVLRLCDSNRTSALGSSLIGSYRPQAVIPEGMFDRCARPFQNAALTVRFHSNLVMHPPSLEVFAPSRDELLDRVSELVDDSILREISEADYGQDADAHLPYLRRLRDQGELPPAQWHPREVLELIRWSEPEDPDWKPGSTGRRGHIMRAFASTALLRMGSEPSNRNYFEGENQTLAQLLVSVDVLGAPLPLSTRRFLAWRLPLFTEHDEERPFFILALLLLALDVHPRAPESYLQDLLDWLKEDERRVREWAVLPKDSGSWLLGLTHFDLRHRVWKSMALRLTECAKVIDSVQLRQGLLEVAGWLMNDPPARERDGTQAN